jgi:hypothetical protein
VDWLRDCRLFVEADLLIFLGAPRKNPGSFLLAKNRDLKNLIFEGKRHPSSDQ